jgi:hypothetical protein
MSIGGRCGEIMAHPPGIYEFKILMRAISENAGAWMPLRAA